jgi:hypothetical protein
MKFSQENNEEERFQLEKKDRLIDTLIIVTGFIVAASYNSANIMHLYLIFGFLIFAILTKSHMIGSNPNPFIINSAYFCLSFCFPLIFIFFFFDNGAFDDIYITPLVLNPLVSATIFTSLIKEKELLRYARTNNNSAAFSKSALVFFIIDTVLFLVMMK